MDFDEVFQTPDDGEVVIYGLTLRDHDPLGDIDFAEVIRQSSNIATAEIAMRLENDKFYQYARNMGFGTPSYVDISGEESGRMAKPYDWSLVSLPWMSHGYELLATPIQVAQAYSAFANNGMMMRPYIVERVENANGEIISQHEPVQIRRIAKKSTLQKLYPIFESVVSDSGTGEFAQVDGLRIAGKTGTAKKVVDGRYTNNYRGSFVGFFPVEDPKYISFILLDEPKPVGYGGYTAAPIFGQVARRIAGLDSDLQYRMMEEPEKDEMFTLVPLLQGLTKNAAVQFLAELEIDMSFEGQSGYVVSQVPAPGDTLFGKQSILLTLSETNMPTDSASVRKGFATIPDLNGMNMRTATAVLSKLGFEVDRIGSGTVFAQFPRAEEMMRIGGKVTIRGRARSLETITQLSTN